MVCGLVWSILVLLTDPSVQSGPVWSGPVESRQAQQNREKYGPKTLVQPETVSPKSPQPQVLNSKPSTFPDPLH